MAVSIVKFNHCATYFLIWQHGLWLYCGGRVQCPLSGVMSLADLSEVTSHCLLTRLTRSRVAGWTIIIQHCLWLRVGGVKADFVRRCVEEKHSV